MSPVWVPKSVQRPILPLGWRTPFLPHPYWMSIPVGIHAGPPSSNLVCLLLEKLALSNQNEARE